MANREIESGAPAPKAKPSKFEVRFFATAMILTLLWVGLLSWLAFRFLWR